MEDMDIDDIIYVPDTPDRVISRRGISRNPRGLDGNLVVPRNFRSNENVNDRHLRKPPINHPSKPFKIPRPANSNGINGNSETSFTSQNPSSSHRARYPNGVRIVDKGKSVATDSSICNNPKTFFHNGVAKEKGKGQVALNGNSESWENARNAPMEIGKIDENSPKITRRKCLVRNGCISPLNIAKTELLKSKSGNIEPSFNDNGVSDLAQPSRGSDRNRMKGKAVLIIPENPKEQNEIDFFANSSGTSTDNRDAFGSQGEGGWRTTRSNSGKPSNIVPDESRRSSRRIVSEKNSQRPESRSERRENGQSHRIERDRTEIDASVRATSSISETGQSSGRFRSDKMVNKRLTKQGSTSMSEDQELMELVRPSSSRAHHSRSFDSSCPIIDVDELSPPVRRSRVMFGSTNDDKDSDATKMQVEADEILARELQEQFYSEMPVLESNERGSSIANLLRHDRSQINEGPSSDIDEIDEHMAWIMQQVDDDIDVAYNASGSANSHVPRQPRSRATQSRANNRPSRAQNAPRARARTSSSIRMAELRGGRVRQRRARATTFQFPPDMDFDTRQNILGTLEAAFWNDADNNNPMHQLQRDFNENDYEMLLALDDLNHRHGGASSNQINLLPESVVQTDNQETCAVCLETPTIGETVRHLPCFHKFHKDCIDPWLSRKTSCPICKCSVT